VSAMGDVGRSSILVHILVIALCLAAFGFAIAAERRRSTVLYTLPQAASFFSLGKICWETPLECGFCSGPLKNIVFAPKH